jgi:predicted nuclease with TOPRIM domain
MRVHKRYDTEQADEDRQRERERMLIPDRLAELEGIEGQTTKRLAAVEAQVKALSAVFMPSAMKAMARDLEDLLDDVAGAHARLRSERAEFAAKMKADKEKLAKLTLEKLGQA